MSGVIESQKREINRALEGGEQHRRDQQLIHEQLLEQNRELREASVQSFNEMEDLKRFQGFTFDTFLRSKLIGDRDTIFELTGKIQELQNEVNFLNDSIDFKDAESISSGQSLVTSQPAFFHSFSKSWWNSNPLFALFICLSHLLLHPPDLSLHLLSMWIGSELNPLCASANEESGPLVNNVPLTVSKG